MRPIEGVSALVDLTTQRVLAIADGDTAPVLPMRRFAPDVAPPALNLSKLVPAGTDVRMTGGTIRWRHWRLHVATHPREGVVLHHVAYTDGARERSMLYRASVSEMVVPYGDSGRDWVVRNALDEGELGLGHFVSLQANVDVPAGAMFLNALAVDGTGIVRTQPRAVAVYERDGGLAWRFGTQARRSRELVVEWISTLGNYEYGFAWTFHEDGVIEQRATLMGIMSAKGTRRWPADSVTRADAHGQRVTDVIVAPHHQHFFAFRLDTDVDGAAHQQVVEVEGQPSAADDPQGAHSGMQCTRTLLMSERAAQRFTSSSAARRWVVENTAVRNAVRGAVGLSLVPSENALPLADTSSWIRKRAGFLDAQLWVTPYRRDELYAAGDYPNQSRGGAGLPTFTRGDTSVRDTDVVLWYIMGITHLPRAEDWPVMPSHVAGFKPVPTGFFSSNPLVRDAK
ncbi:hypothetical protein [Gemmatimonas sp.]|uniref:copper amine oxidase n=1 Tax=Gemmatimonas sp. TaxID=1962908 RepID=UPI003565EC0B